MKLVRDSLSVVATLVLAGGYLASIQATGSGQTQEYITKLEAAPIRLLALLLLLAAVALSFVPDSDPGGAKDSG